MTWTTHLTNLRDLLSSLYSTTVDAGRIADEVGLDQRFIWFENNVINVWHDILNEAKKHGKVMAIIEIAYQQYPQNKKIVEFFQFYQAEQKTVKDLNSTMPAVKELYNQGISGLQDVPVQNVGYSGTPSTHIINNSGTVVFGNVNSAGDFIGRDRSENKASNPIISNTLDSSLVRNINKVQGSCNKLLVTLADASSKKTLVVIQKWLNQVTQIPPNLLNVPELQAPLIQAYPSVVEKFVAHARDNLNNFKDSGSRENEVYNDLDRLYQKFSEVDTDIRQPLDDLRLVVASLFHLEPFRTHEFVDASLAGTYVNLAWTEEARRVEVAQILEDLLKDAHSGSDIYRDILGGAFICEQIIQVPLLQLPTLLRQVADDYVTHQYREVYKDTYPWWEGIASVIGTVDHTKPELATWCEGKRNEKARYEYNKQRIERGLPPRRLLWPLALSDETNNLSDANYDFPSVAERIDDTATQTSYFRVNSKINAFDICKEHLSHHSHHIITGQPKAGKSWLRLYLEYFCLMTDEKLLPLFYFAPASLAYQTTVIEIIENLARSVANQLFTDLLARSSNRTSTDDPWRTSRIAITSFLRRYGYTLPNKHGSLAQPIPPKHLLDIELAYGNSYLGTVYAQMKQEIDALPASFTATPTTEEIFDAIQRAIELVGYQSIFVLVDNWDTLPAAPRRRLLKHLLHSDLLAQLYRRGIFLKLFMPELPDAAIAQFDKTCEIKRESLHQLTLYTYRESNVESKSVQTTDAGA